MIVMGFFLIIVAWRMAKESEGWAPRLMVGGAFLLFLGYAFLIPMYEAGKIERYHPSVSLSDPAGALAWHAVKLVVMNAGWLVFGLGLGLHTGLLRMPGVSKVPRRQTIPINESVA